MFIGRTDVEAETQILWPPDVKSWLIGKDPDAGRDWGQEEKGMTEDEMAGWHHGLYGHEFEWTPGVGDGQGGLPCCDSWGCKESDTTERLNWIELSAPWDMASQSLFSTCYRFSMTTGEHLGEPANAGLSQSFPPYRDTVSRFSDFKQNLASPWAQRKQTVGSTVWGILN